MSSAIGIDYGDSRIGIAVSDRLGLVATPRCVLDGKKSLNEVCEAIGEIYRKEQCDTVVIGYPLNMDGTSGNRVHRTEKFIGRFTEMFPEAEIVVSSACCAGVTPEKHQAALETMASCQIGIL